MTNKQLIQGTRALVQKIYDIEDTLGWHDEPTNLSDRLNNITAEIAEIWEEWRNHHEPTETYYECQTTHCELSQEYCKNCEFGKPCGIPSEFADIIIWIMDYCAEVGIDIAEMIVEKAEYNATRTYRHGKRI